MTNHDAARTAAANSAYPHLGNGVKWSPHPRERQHLDRAAQTDDSWRQGAACRGLPMSLFFGELAGDSTVTTAKRVCTECEVRLECLAVGLHEYYGVWGGLTVNERQVYRLGRRGSEVSLVERGGWPRRRKGAA